MQVRHKFVDSEAKEVKEAFDKAGSNFLDWPKFRVKEVEVDPYDGDMTLTLELIREVKESVDSCIHSGKEWFGRGKCPFCLGEEKKEKEEG